MFWNKLRNLLPVGTLTIVLPNGQRRTIGDGTGAPIEIAIHDWRTVWGLATQPRLKFGEAYMNGTLEFVTGGLTDLFALYEANEMNRDSAPSGWLSRVDVVLGRLSQRANSRYRARRNVAHHYDLSGSLYRQFLDDEMHYSCAYFSEPGMSLEAAQAAKCKHIANKLLLKPGQRVLDIGSGWGGLARSLAKSRAASVTGLTLSTEQLAESRKRTKAAGLSDQVSFELLDYREAEGVYDRVVSVGMFEHVGPSDFDAFFGMIRDRLTPDGIALLHSIGRKGPPGGTNPWISKYIFPGGYVPALSETLAAIERSGLWVTDVEILRLHYAETCRHWRERFHRNEKIIRQIYDDRFFRMWDLYLAVSEAGFRSGDLMVFQIQLSRRVNGVPLTRGYMTTEPRRIESGSMAA